MAVYDEVINQTFSTSGLLGIETHEDLIEAITVSGLSLELSAMIVESALYADSAPVDQFILRAAIETLTVSGVISALDAVKVFESLGLSAAADPTGSTFNSLASQALSFKELTVVSWALLAADSVNVAPSATPKAEWVMSLVERLISADIVANRANAVAAASVAVALTSSWESGKGASVLDAVDVTPAVIQQAIMLAAEVEAIDLADLAAGTMVVTTPALENFTAGDTVTPNQILQQVLADGLMFGVSFGFGGEVYSGWVMNTDSFAVSEYQNYPFNSFAKIGSKYYGANENGLYLLEGSDDAGTSIDATFTTGKMSFGKKLSRVSNSYLALRNDGRMLVKVIADDDTESWYELTETDWTLRDKRVKLGRGIKSRYWQFTLSNADGADFEIDSLVLLPILLKRR